MCLARNTQSFRKHFRSFRESVSCVCVILRQFSGSIMPTLDLYYEYDQDGHLVPQLEEKFDKEYEQHPKEYDSDDVQLIRSQKW